MLEKFVWVVLIGIVIWVGYATLFTERGNPFDFGTTTPPMGCIAPENPYSVGSPYHKGFDWGREGKGCMHESPLFEEGCREYEALLVEYQACLATED